MTSATSTMASLLSILFFCSLSDINLTIHSAQAVRFTLPSPLQSVNVTKRMRMHFCGSISIEQCPTALSDMSICSNLCNSDPAMQVTCNEITGSSMCLEDDQHPYCEYQDAIVCQYNDMTGSCVHSNSSSVSPFCVCKVNGRWPFSEEELFPIRQSCKDDVTPSNQPSSTHQPAMTSAGQSTTSAGQSTTSAGQSTTFRGLPDCGSGQVNMEAIILGLLLALVVLLVIIAVVLLRRRGALPTWMVSSKHRESPSNGTYETAFDEQRPREPTPLVPGSGEEYAYAVDIRERQQPVVRSHENNNDHSYINAKSKEGTGGRNNPRFVGDEQGPHIMKETNFPAGTTITNNEGGNRTYFPLLPTPKRLTEDANSGYEIPDAGNTQEKVASSSR